jgi:uncharacterized protein (DUF433 family)
MPQSIATHIETTPGVCGGKPRIAGHRITVQNIAIWHERMGLSADEIVADHPGISLADVYAALTYYWANREEIDRAISDDDAFVEKLRSQAGPSLLSQKLGKNHGPLDSLSSR